MVMMMLKILAAPFMHRLHKRCSHKYLVLRYNHAGHNDDDVYDNGEMMEMMLKTLAAPFMQ